MSFLRVTPIKSATDVIRNEDGVYTTVGPYTHHVIVTLRIPRWVYQRLLGWALWRYRRRRTKQLKAQQF